KTLCAHPLCSPWWSFSRRSSRHGDPFHREHLDDVADLDVVEPFEADATLEASLHFADIVLEPSQRPNLPFVDHDVVANETGVGVAGPRDPPFGDQTAGDRSVLRHLEGIAHLRNA